MNTPVCDYLIVGGGTAGCVLANRLSADPSCRVILLEAGGPDDDKWIHIPAGIRYLLREKGTMVLMPRPAMTNGRSVYWPRGKVLGGSSSINGMVYIRGQHGLRPLGHRATGWDWDSLFPYFLKIENQTRGADAYHAVGGPLTVSGRANRSGVWTRHRGGGFLGIRNRTSVPTRRASATTGLTAAAAAVRPWVSAAGEGSRQPERHHRGDGAPHQLRHGIPVAPKRTATGMSCTP